MKTIFLLIFTLISTVSFAASQDFITTTQYKRNTYMGYEENWTTLEQAGLLWYTEQSALRKCFQAGASDCRIFQSEVSHCNYTQGTDVYDKYCDVVATARGNLKN